MKRFQVRTGNRSPFVVIDTDTANRMPFDTLNSAMEYASAKNNQVKRG